MYQHTLSLQRSQGNALLHPSHIPSCTPPNTVQLQLEAAYLMYDVGDRDLGFAH